MSSKISHHLARCAKMPSESALQNHKLLEIRKKNHTNIYYYQSNIIRNGNQCNQASAGVFYQVNAICFLYVRNPGMRSHPLLIFQCIKLYQQICALISYKSPAGGHFSYAHFTLFSFTGFILITGSGIFGGCLFQVSFDHCVKLTVAAATLINI